MSASHELKGPLIYLGVGGALLYLPTSVQVGLSTFWSHPNPYAYQTEMQDSWVDLLQAVFMILQLIGTIAFIRGLVMLTHLGGHRANQALLEKRWHILLVVYSVSTCIN